MHVCFVWFGTVCVCVHIYIFVIVCTCVRAFVDARVSVAFWNGAVARISFCVHGLYACACVALCGCDSCEWFFSLLCI